MRLAARIEVLEAMSAVEKRAAWRETFRAPTPPALGSGMMARALAYRWQEKAEGGLTRKELRQLSVLANKDAKIRKGEARSAIKPGTWLTRVWHGERHEVVVLDKGYDYRGERFTSLSAIAERITGAKWSGPRFFGLLSPRMGKLGVTDGR
jgi:hypothetical protein